MYVDKCIRELRCNMSSRPADLQIQGHSHDHVCQQARMHTSEAPFAVCNAQVQKHDLEGVYLCSVGLVSGSKTACPGARG